jgi:hypothetical protein
VSGAKNLPSQRTRRKSKIGRKLQTIENRARRATHESSKQIFHEEAHCEKKFARDGSRKEPGISRRFRAGSRRKFAPLRAMIWRVFDSTASDRTIVVSGDNRVTTIDPRPYCRR